MSLPTPTASFTEEETERDECPGPQPRGEDKNPLGKAERLEPRGGEGAAAGDSPRVDRLWLTLEKQSSARPVSGLLSQQGTPFQGEAWPRGHHLTQGQRGGMSIPTNGEMCKPGPVSRWLPPAPPRHLLRLPPSSWVPKCRAEGKRPGSSVASTLPQTALTQLPGRAPRAFRHLPRK